MQNIYHLHFYYLTVKFLQQNYFKNCVLYECFYKCLARGNQGISSHIFKYTGIAMKFTYINTACSHLKTELTVLSISFRIFLIFDLHFYINCPKMMAINLKKMFYPLRMLSNTIFHTKPHTLSYFQYFTF